MSRRPGRLSPAENSSGKESKSEPLSSKNEDRSEEKTENMKTAPDEAELKLTAKLPDFVLKEIRCLEGVSYYHGMAARDIVETKLSRCGDYLIRATDNRISEFEFILSFYNRKRIHSHLTIKADLDLKKWHLGVVSATKFQSIIDLINHFKTHPIGIGFFLRRAVSKGKHMIAHDRINYSPEKDLLGSGNFSDVFRGKLELENISVKVALKNSKKLDDMLDETKNSEANKIKKEMIQEAEVMSQLRHTNITAFFGMATDRLPVLIVIEFCNGGNLYSHLLSFGTKITHQERMLYIHDASAGLKYIHSMSITHRDIAARNCLISVNGFVKLSDFGLGLKLNRHEKSRVNEQTCPSRWMAPETCASKKSKFSKASDVWAMGILSWEIFTNAARPYFNVADEEVRAAVHSGKCLDIPQTAGAFMTRLMKQSFQFNPTDRIGGEMFHDEVHAHCVQNKYLTLEGLTLNLIPGVHRERLEHWEGYVPQVVLCDKNGNEKDWGDAPAEMLSNVVWRG